MFKVIEEKEAIIIEINGKKKCWYHPDYGRRDLKKKVTKLLERGLVEL